MRRWFSDFSASLFGLVAGGILIIIINFDQGPNWVRVATGAVICFTILAFYCLGKLFFLLLSLLF